MSDELFCKYDLYSALEDLNKKLHDEVMNMTADYILKVDEAQLIDHLLNKYSMQPIELNIEDVTIEQKEINIDVSHDPLRIIIDRSRPVYRKGNRISYFIPFSGDPNLFNFRPSQMSSMIPFAKIINNNIIISIETLDYNPDKIKDQFNAQLRLINEYTAWINSDLQSFNNKLPSKLIPLITARKSKLLKNVNLVNELGYPLRSRNNLPETYIAPVMRKRIIPAPTVSKYSNSPAEPELSYSDYEYILKVISDMSLVMEKSPATFVKLSEEEIRDHFLMHLNGHYEGNATGETFNYEGKTDILIKDKGKNIFIAECKFWNGAKKLIETVDQLLGYLSWRDTKTSILLFNRNKDFTNVIKQIPDIIKSHSNFKQELLPKAETNFRYKFKNRDDEGRDLFLTVLAFNIPKLD
ncbi:MAG: hypothetical protein ACM3P0_09340 [Acidobacteriota bacterium]